MALATMHATPACSTSSATVSALNWSKSAQTGHEKTLPACTTSVVSTEEAAVKTPITAWRGRRVSFFRPLPTALTRRAALS